MLRPSLLTVSLSLSLWAQSAAPPEPIVIEGKVVNASTGEKLKKATVRLQPTANPQQSPFAATSDGEGNFRFESVEPGSYRLIAEKPGYLTSQYGARREFTAGTILKVAAGQKMTGLSFPMMPEARLTGRVLDEDGDPAGRAFVQILRYTYNRGKRQLTPRSGTSTDANGEFKTGGLPPGRYYLVALPMPTPASRIATAKPGEPEESYVSTYYPSSLEVEGATPVDILAGREVASIDIRLRKARTYRIRGKVAGGGSQQLQVSVVLRDQSPGFGMFISGASTQEGGKFELVNVRPGSYYVLASNMMGMEQILGAAPVDVTNSNLENVTVQFQPAQTVNGQVIIEGDAKDVKMASMRVFLSGEGLPSFVQPASVKEDGTFAIENVGASKYRVNLYPSPTDGYVKSVRWGDREVVDSLLDLSAGANGTLTITISMTGGQINGSVTTDKPASVDQPAAQAVGMIVLVPDPPQPEQPQLYKIGNVDQTGSFTLTGIRPGQYRLFAWEDIENGAWLDPEVLKKFDSKSVKVTVTEKGTSSATLPLISAEQTGEAKAAGAQ